MHTYMKHFTVHAKKLDLANVPPKTLINMPSPTSTILPNIIRNISY